jgi:hypothetical protein
LKGLGLRFSLQSSAAQMISSRINNIHKMKGTVHFKKKRKKRKERESEKVFRITVSVVLYITIYIAGRRADIYMVDIM